MNLMRRFLPVIVLIVMAPLVAEVLPGSTPITLPAFLLSDLLFPARRTTPYLHRFGLIVTGIWYILGVALLGLFARTTYPYKVSPILLGLVVLLVLMLVVVALGVLPRQAPRPQLPLN